MAKPLKHATTPFEDLEGAARIRQANAAKDTPKARRRRGADKVHEESKQRLALKLAALEEQARRDLKPKSRKTA